MKQSLPALLAIACACIGISCSSPTESPTISATGSVAPIVTGLRVTSPAGSEQVMVWGNPSYPDRPVPSSGHVGPGVIPAPTRTDYYCSNPYPNPTSGTIDFTIPINSDGALRIWITQARPLGLAGTDATITGGATVAAPEMATVRILQRGDLVRPAGTYTFEWDGKDDGGRDAPAGFYRLYVMQEGTLVWHDILLYRSLGDVPRDLRGLVASWQ